MVEFTVNGFRALEANCRAVFTSWLSINASGKREREWLDQHQLDEFEEDRRHIEDALTALLTPNSDEPKPPDEYIKLHQSLALQGHAEHLDCKRRRDLSPVLQIEITPSDRTTRWRAP